VNKLFRENVVSFLVRTTYVKGIVTKVARWPHGCRRKYSEVAVPMLVSSNLTEGGGVSPREKPPPGHGCVCMSPRG
jgi:hypothetical protein